jgi:hypothetical protein
MREGVGVASVFYDHPYTPKNKPGYPLVQVRRVPRVVLEAFRIKCAGDGSRARAVTSVACSTPMRASARSCSTGQGGAPRNPVDLAQENPRSRRVISRSLRASRLHETTPSAQPETPMTCKVCDGRLRTPTTGRRPTYCSVRCKAAARQWRDHARLASRLRARARVAVDADSAAGLLRYADWLERVVADQRADAADGWRRAQDTVDRLNSACQGDD